MSDLDVSIAEIQELYKDKPAVKGSLSEVEQIVLQREKEYGGFEGVSEMSQESKAIFRAHPKWDGLENWKKEAIEMTLHKMARLVNGNSDSKEGWLDGQGYLKLPLDIIERNEQEK